MTARLHVTAPPEAAGKRLDSWLAEALAGSFSRARLQSLIDEGAVLCNGKPAKASLKLKGGEEVGLDEPEAVDATPKAQNIALDIVYEDKHLLVINKQAGLTVHPGAGQHDGTLVNALLHHCGDTLSGIGGVKRPGIVHRLDKDTTGLLLVAKNDHAHRFLSDQLADRTLSRTYQALVWGQLMPPIGVVDQPIGRHTTNRLKQAVQKSSGKPAVTHYRSLKHLPPVSLVECQLETGRTHQIRVHMNFIGHPLVGDMLYGLAANAQKAKVKEMDEAAQNYILTFPRQALHACAIEFVHPKTGKDMAFEAPLPDDMQAALTCLQR